MKDYIEERAVEIAAYIIDNNATVRQTAKQFGISKSTVHKDVTERLIQINPALAKEARRYWIRISQNVIFGEGWLRGKNICTKCYLNRSESSLQIESEPNILERYSKVRISSKR